GPRARTPRTGPRTTARPRWWSSPSTSSSPERPVAVTGFARRLRRRNAVRGEVRRGPPRPPSIISLPFRADREPGAPGDEPRAALVGDVGPGPLEQDHEAIAIHAAVTDMGQDHPPH